MSPTEGVLWIWVGFVVAIVVGALIGVFVGVQDRRDGTWTDVDWE